jgi:hypothetical protein
MSTARPPRPIAAVPPPAPYVPERWPESLLLHDPNWPLRVLELALKGLNMYDGPDEVKDYLEPLYVLAYDVRRAADERTERDSAVPRGEG